MRFSMSIAMSVASILVSSTSFAWGQKGHQMVNRVAIPMVNHPEGRKFFQANQDQVIMFASTPDTRWKSGASGVIEKPYHWFEIDGYSTSSFGDGVAEMLFGRAKEQLGTDFVTKYGLAMWRVSTLYQDLVAALKQKDWIKSIQVAGVIGHYVGDMTQPMHSSIDYDGQSINKPGIHKYYETTLVDQINKEQLFNTVLVVAGEQRHGIERSIGNDMTPVELQRVIYDQAEASYNSLDEILVKFNGDPNDAWLIADLKPRLARASALLGKIWDAAIATSGVRNLPQNTVNAPEPAWIPMN